MQSWQMHVVDCTLREFGNSCSDRGTSTLQVKDNTTTNSIDVTSWRGLNATRCNTLQHAATRCNTLQHTATTAGTSWQVHVLIQVYD